MPVPVAARSNAKVYGRSPAEIVGLNPTGGKDVCLLWVLCCQVEVLATDWSLVQRSPTDCGVSLCVIRNLENEEAKTRYGAVENITERVVTPRKQTTIYRWSKGSISMFAEPLFPLLTIILKMTQYGRQLWLGCKLWILSVKVKYLSCWVGLFTAKFLAAFCRDS